MDIGETRHDIPGPPRRQGRDRHGRRVHSGPGVGTGKATAIVLAQAGASVLLVDIHPERAAETLEVIEKDGGTAAVFAGDMTSSTDAEGAVRAAADRFGSVDILVNNIGVAIAGTVADTSETDWDRSLALSLRTAFLVGLTHAAGQPILPASSTARPPRTAGRRSSGRRCDVRLQEPVKAVGCPDFLDIVRRMSAADVPRPTGPPKGRTPAAGWWRSSASS